jgi:O-antigen/teichoic acid export membrane protein
LSYSGKNIKEFAKGSSILVASNMVLKGIQFLLLPMYTKYLSPEELGISDSITSFTTFLFPILVMAFDSAFSAFYYEKDEENHSVKVFNTVFFFFMIQSLIPIFMTFASGNISQLLFKSVRYSVGVKLALFSISLNLWYLPFSLLTRMQNRMRTFAIINVSCSTVMILLNILFVSVFQWGYMAMLASTFIVNILQIFLYILTCRVNISKKWTDKRLFRRMLAYALPFIPTTISTWILNMSDRYMLLFIAGKSEVGIYGIGARFVTILSVVISGVATAYTSFAFQNVKDKKAKEMFSDVVNVIFVFLAGICTTVALFGKEIIELMATRGYQKAYLLLAALMFSQLAYALYTFTGYGIAFEKKSKYYFYSVSLGALVNVLLNVWLLPKMGAEGAALTTLIGTVIMFIVTYYFSNKLYPCDYGILKIVVVFLLLYTTCVVFRDLSLGVKILVWIIDATITLVIYRTRIIKVFKIFKK